MIYDHRTPFRAIREIRLNLFQQGLNPRGGGGYSHIWAIRVCAAQQGMSFASLTLEQGIKIALFLWNRLSFISGLTLE